MFDKLTDKKEEKEGYRENYYKVNAEYNSENPEKNKFTYASSTEKFTVTGFRKIENFYGGVAEADNQDGEPILIDKNGKEITQAGKYSWMDRIKDDKDYFEARDAETNFHGLIELAEGADDIRADATFIDDKWLLEGDYVHALYDEKGKQVFDFGMHTRAYQDEKGNAVFISKDEGKCIIRDKNCKEISTVENVEYGYSFGGGYFCGYPIVDGGYPEKKIFMT